MQLFWQNGIHGASSNVGRSADCSDEIEPVPEISELASPQLLMHFVLNHTAFLFQARDQMPLENLRYKRLPLVSQTQGSLLLMKLVKLANFLHFWKDKIEDLKKLCGSGRKMTQNDLQRPNLARLCFNLGSHWILSQYPIPFGRHLFVLRCHRTQQSSGS